MNSPMVFTKSTERKKPNLGFTPRSRDSLKKRSQAGEVRFLPGAKKSI